MLVFPEMVAGCAGVELTDTLSACAAEVPQELDAVTEIAPPALPEVAVMVLEVLLPDQPAGRVQL